MRRIDRPLVGRKALRHKAPERLVARWVTDTTTEETR